MQFRSTSGDPRFDERRGQRFDATFGGAQLARMQITQLHQMAQLPVRAAGYVYPAQFTAAQAHRQVLAIESIRFHSLTWFGRDRRRGYYQTRMMARHQLVMQTKTGRSGFVNKGDSLAGKMFVHVIKQVTGPVGQPQRLG